MREFVRNCHEHMPVDVLSGWRDHALGPGLTERVADHIPTCRACQTYLHQYDQDAMRLRRFTPPPLQAEAWQLVERRIRQSAPGSNHRRFLGLFAGSGALLTVLVVVVLFALLFKNTSGRPGSTTLIPTATAPNKTTPTPPTGTPSANHVWADIPTLNFGKALAFAASDPQTGYVCGNNPPNGTSAPLQIATTHDGGQTWSQPLSTGINQVACRLFVNPSNPQELAMNASGCWQGCSGSGQFGPNLYRSFDGGQTWQQQTFPTSGSEVAMSAPIWVKGALFVYTAVVSSDSIIPFQRGTHSIAMSLNGGPLQWVNDGPVFAGISDTSVEVNAAFGYNGNYLVRLSGTGATFKTSDYGATWARLTFAGNITLTDVAADGQTLLGINPSNQQYVRSNDGGQNWTTFTVPPNTTRILSAPDGTYYAGQVDPTTNIVKTIYKQAPGGQTWASVAVIDPLQRPTLTWATVSWDANGKPQHLWATEATMIGASFAAESAADRPASSSGYTPGIAEHAP